MTRIVSGSAGGRVLSVPRSGTRPTSERVREALFSRLEHYDVVAGARVLDLYAGSGALGLEALSRGAAQVTLVDCAKNAAAICEKNIRAVNLPGAQVVTTTVLSYLHTSAGKTADLVFMDPPYNLAEKQINAVLTVLSRSEDPWLNPQSVVVLERSARSAQPTWPAALMCFSKKTYGQTNLWFAQLDNA